MSGAYLVDRAKKLARSLLRFKQNSRTEIVDGFMIRATVDTTRFGQTATGVVIDPPGVVLVLEASLDTRGELVSVGGRDFFDSRTGLTNGPFLYAQRNPQPAIPKFLALVFDPLDPFGQWQLSSLWRTQRISVNTAVRTNFLRITPSSEGWPFDVYDQVPTDVNAFVATYQFDGASAASTTQVQRTVGYALNEGYIDAAAPGYRLFCRTSLGYMAQEYQAMPCASDRIGNVTLMAVPVVNLASTSSAVEWGTPGVLFLLLNGYDANQGTIPSELVWSRLWTPAEHSVDFYHPGPWLAEPHQPFSSPETAPQENWDAFWSAWHAGGEVQPAGGSRPNWTDAISCCAHNGEFHVNLRQVAYNGVFADEGSPLYQMAGGEARIKFVISPTGDFAMQELGDEVWSAPNSGAGGTVHTPYERWVEGRLDEAVVTLAVPLATMQVGGHLVEVRMQMEGTRDEQFVFGYARGQMPATMGSQRLVVDVTPTDAPAFSLDVVFDTLGAGLQMFTFLRTGDFVMGPATSSYKMWPCQPMFVEVSDTELGFIAYTDWQDFNTEGTRSVRFCVLDLESGAYAVRSTLPFIHELTVGHEYQVHVSCMQKTVRTADSDLVVDGVLFLSYRGADPVFISRDSGATWQEYFDSERAAAGAYYLGNPLQLGRLPGAAVLSEAP
jgi:hypothetical protein